MENYKFFQNKSCEKFPCHRTSSDKFNCLFCYCPLYMLGKECGGNFTYLDNGVKSCKDCAIPHSENGYTHIMKHIDKVIKQVKNNNKTLD